MAAPAGNQNAKGNKGPPKRIYTPERLAEEAIALREWVKHPENLFIQDFAYDRGYHPTRLAEFKKESIEMSLAIDEFKGRQESKLLKGGLFKGMDGNFVKYTLPRVNDNPIWKQSWDQPEERADTPTTVIINKL